MGKRDGNLSKSETFQTAISGQISTPRVFAFSLYWLPGLQNGVLKTVSTYQSLGFFLQSKGLVPHSSIHYPCSHVTMGLQRA